MAQEMGHALGAHTGCAACRLYPVRSGSQKVARVLLAAKGGVSAPSGQDGGAAAELEEHVGDQQRLVIARVEAVGDVLVRNQQRHLAGLGLRTPHARDVTPNTHAKPSAQARITEEYTAAGAPHDSLPMRFYAGADALPTGPWYSACQLKYL